MNVRELPLAERPRERLRSHGAEALSTIELLAILLSTGTKKLPVMDLAARILTHFGSLKRLISCSIEELMEIDGIGPAKAVQLKAALSLAHKAIQESHPASESIDSKEAYELVRYEFSSLKQEALFVVLKDVKGKLISVEKVSIGTLSEVLVHPREVFFPAVRHKASSLIIAHNHPSGDPTPSNADLEMTRHLIKSSRVMGIDLDDHLIVGANSYISLKNSGYFASAPRCHS
jgi:DNA repair protein RadC